MQQTRLYRFLNLLHGNWRNAAYIECASCPYEQECGDHLLAIDFDGTPVIYPLNAFQQQTGERVEKADCIILLPRSVFTTLYQRWMLWNTLDPNQCSIRQMIRDPPDDNE